MKPTVFSHAALQRICYVMLLTTLSGCHWDLFGGDGSDRAAAAPSYGVGGTVSGLAPGGRFTLTDNGADTLNINANGTFTFSAALPANASFVVATGSQPTGQNCTVAGGTGSIRGASVTNIAVTCTDQTYSLGGTVAGLISPGLVLANGSATLAVSSGAQSFTFPTAIAFESTYSVTIMTQPVGLTCAVSAGGGVMPASAVTSVVVGCTPQSFTIGGTITGLGAYIGLTLANGSDTLAVPANATQFTMPSSVPFGASYSVVVTSHSPAIACAVTNGSGTMGGAKVTNIGVSCTPGAVSVLHSFAGALSDGSGPWWGSLLLASDGNFYGMTFQGGANNLGAVFKLTPAGVETLLWSFGSGTDGVNPYGSLIQGSDGNFYGMTNLGGTYNRGTVFKITPAGVESVIRSFGAPNDGAYPYGSLIQAADGNFYGVTYAYVGGTGSGMVFKMTPAGVETILWVFGNGTDGQYPYSRLIQGSDGAFYGMTNLGGANNKGTLFRITPAGAETVLWSFGGTGDGSQPFSCDLTLGMDGNFYGMTPSGGANNWGAIFKYEPGGTETVLYSFTGGADGGQPNGGLLQGPDGNFYGTTELGGGYGNGALIEVTPGGAETALWTFTSGISDGGVPRGDLILGAGGALYGMSEGGGANNLGTVFKFQ